MTAPPDTPQAPLRFVYCPPMADHPSEWAFPLRGRGLPVLLGGLGLIALTTALAAAAVFLVPASLATVLAIYLCAFAYLIVQDVSRGADAIASWPGLPTREAFFVPVVRFVAGALWGCLPAFVYRLLTDQADILFWLLFLLGVYLLPMVLVRVSTRESFLAGHPLAVLISILRTARDYTATCIPYYLAVLVAVLAATVFAREQWWEIVGIGYGLAFYLMLVVLDRLGLFYRRNSSRLYLRGIFDALPPRGAGLGEPCPRDRARRVRPAS
jgi:hypothetical protein